MTTNVMLPVVNASRSACTALVPAKTQAMVASNKGLVQDVVEFSTKKLPKKGKMAMIAAGATALIAGVAALFGNKKAEEAPAPSNV